MEQQPLRKLPAQIHSQEWVEPISPNIHQVFGDFGDFRFSLNE
jgi:hypothetical protein